jgi:endonuclease YncB( thermonuclease family)
MRAARRLRPPAALRSLSVAKAIFQTKGGLTVGRVRLGVHGSVQGSVAQETHDGDTVVVGTGDNVGVRFLGIDAPEISFTLPGGTLFVPIADARWETFLSDPFAAGLPAFDPPLHAGLRQHIRARTGPGTAASHARLAEKAEQALEQLILQDIAELGQTGETFRFFLAFANEVMDGYGRLLCYLNRDQPDKVKPAPRPESYNERLLATGAVSPYFIWPNLDPYRRAAAGARRGTRVGRAGAPLRPRRLRPRRPAAPLPVRAALPGAPDAARALGDRPLRRRRPDPRSAALLPDREPGGPAVRAVGVRAALRREGLEADGGLARRTA